MRSVSMRTSTQVNNIVWILPHQTIILLTGAICLCGLDLSLLFFSLLFLLCYILNRILRSVPICSRQRLYTITGAMSSFCFFLWFLELNDYMYRKMIGLNINNGFLAGAEFPGTVWETKLPLSCSNTNLPTLTIFMRKKLSKLAPKVILITYWM